MIVGYRFFLKWDLIDSLECNKSSSRCILSNKIPQKERANSLFLASEIPQFQQIFYSLSQQLFRELYLKTKTSPTYLRA